jgi:effector-binding domain-containing protein
VKGPPVALYHDPEFKEADADVEVAFPLWKDVKTDGEFKMVDLPGSDSMASVTYKGPYDKIGEAYSALIRWVEKNNYHLVGPTREIYLTDPAKTKPSDYVTEVQAPVGKN